MSNEDSTKTGKNDHILGEEHEHESFGIVGFVRTTGNPGKLFGSPLENHNHYITLRIGRCKLYRRDDQDHYYGGHRGDIIEVSLSEGQFAQLITTMNQGNGVPCTLSYINGKRMEPPPVSRSESENIRTKFDERVRKFAKDLLKGAGEIRATMEEKKTLNREDRKRVTKFLDNVAVEINNNMGFFLEVFNESAERVVTAAKAEADAWLTAVIHRAGLKSLQEAADGTGPKLLEPGKPDEG